MSKMTKSFVCHFPYLRNHTLYDCHFWYTFVKWYYLQGFSHFLKILILWIVSGVKGKKWKKKKKKKSVCPAPYLRNHTSYDSHLWYTFVKRLYLQVFFSFFQKFDFLGRQGDQRAKNGPKWQQILCCTLYFIFQDPWIIWSSFIVDMCKRIIFPDIFFSIFEMEKNDPK